MDGSPGSRGQEQFPRTESTLTTWKDRLSEAASVFQPFKARTGPEIEKQNRSERTGLLADGSRFPTLDLTTGLGKAAGRPAPSPPKVLNGAEQRTQAALEGQQEVMNVVMQVLKDGEEADAILWRNLTFARKKRDDQLRLVLNKISNRKETASLLYQERVGFSNIFNSWKQEMIQQKQTHDKIVTEMREERNNSEKLLVQKYEKIIKDMKEAPRREAEPTILVQTHERIVTKMQNLCKEKETALIRQHERTIAEMINAGKKEEKAFIQKHERITAEMNAARIEEKAAQLMIQKHEGIVAKMRDERKEAESSLIRRHERVVTEMSSERKNSETLLVQKQEVLISKVEEAHRAAETQLIREHEVAVTELQVARDADTRRIQKYENMIREFEAQVARKKADQLMFTRNYKKLLSAQVDAHREAEARLNQKHEKTVTEMQEAFKEAEKLCIQNYEKIIIEADVARKENEARLLKDYKVEMDAGKGREKEILQKQSEVEAEVVKFKNMYYMALNSYTVLEKEHGEAKQALHAQLESLQCQLAALKEEETTGEKEHAEEAKRAISAVPESPESQVSTYKYTYTTVSKKDLEILALKSQRAELQGDKVKLQEALDALRNHPDRRIKSESDKLSIEILWEVAQKVLCFPEDVGETQTINTSGYETLLSSRKENNVDKMMACVTVALKTAVKNWETAQDEFAKLKLAIEKHIPEILIGRDSGDDSENESLEKFLQKKRRRLRSLTQLKERRSSGQPTGSSRRKRTRPQRFVPGS